MYEVFVYVVNTERLEHHETFEFGSFVEIGYMLDNYGYNDPNYEVRIKFHGRG